MRKDNPVFALVWIHLLAAVVWVGGMVFLSVVLVPVLRRDGAFAQHALLFRTVAYRFRAVVWGAMGILVATGLTLAVGRSIPLTEPSHWPTIFVAKIGFVTLLFTLTLLHDLVVGPQVRRSLGTPEAERTARDRMLLRYSVLVPRMSLLIALLVLLLAVVLART
jgi:putative copper resistance protein D